MNRLAALLKDPKILKTGNFIDGEWVNSSPLGFIPVVNPANEEVIARVVHIDEDNLQKAISAAKRAFPIWRSTSPVRRAKVLHKWCQLLHENKEDLAFIMTSEQGKPLQEAIGEIKYAASYLEFYAEAVKRIRGDILPSPFEDSRIFILKQPVGVVGIITPWNFPAAMFIRKVAAALAAGCTCVVKPDERTPLSALAVMELGRRAGLPPGVVNMITGDPPQIGKILATHPDIAKISFTGSTRVGKLLMQWASGTVKRMSLELGGNAPFLVFEDANLEDAVEGLLLSKFRNTGQTCICVNRVFVHESIIESFISVLKEKVQNLKVGAGSEHSDVGPLIDMRALEKVDRLVKDACRKGAQLCLGGKRLPIGKRFYAPTILRGIHRDMDIFNEEIFGPIIAIAPFKTVDEAISMANDTPYGLASYIYSNNNTTIWRVSEALEYGMVGVNTGSISTAWAPFGGIKQSGFGREGSSYGLEEYLQLKYINMVL